MHLQMIHKIDRGVSFEKFFTPLNAGGKDGIFSVY